MSDETEATPVSKESNPIRPDPLFKDVTRKAALAAGLELLDIELPQLLRADLILAVPQDKDLSNTLFDFISPYSILEFKSENDTFDKSELARALARARLFISENPSVEYHQLLTVFVSAERPDSVIQHLEQEGIALIDDPATPWLLRYRFGALRIAIVVCRLLPLERRYYQWLQFAPATSRKWRDFVKMLARSREWALLEQVKRLNLKEYKLMTPEITQIIKDLSPEEQAEYEKDFLDLVETEVIQWEQIDGEALSERLSRLKSETLLNALNIKALSPEQRRKLIERLTQLDKPTGEDNQSPK